MIYVHNDSFVNDMITSLCWLVWMSQDSPGYICNLSTSHGYLIRTLLRGCCCYFDVIIGLLCDTGMKVLCFPFPSVWILLSNIHCDIWKLLILFCIVLWIVNAIEWVTALNQYNGIHIGMQHRLTNWHEHLWRTSLPNAKSRKFLLIKFKTL